MIRLLLPLLAGFGIDCLLGDPHSLPHPVVLIGKTISALERALRKMFPKTPRGERAAGSSRARASGCARFSSRRGSRRSSSMARSGCPSICALCSRA